MQRYVVLKINEESEASNMININSSEREGGRWLVKTTFSSDQIHFAEKRFRWVAQSVPAFKMEPFMTTYKDYISKMNFELSYIKYPNQPMKPMMGSWSDINERYVESSDFGGEITSNGFLKKIVEEITAGIQSNEEKISAIDRYIKANVIWDGSSKKYTESSLKKVLEQKKGNSAEVNLLLGSMLEKVGFAVSPVLISTRDHGFVRETVPISTQFNYALCLVELSDKKILLDGTDGLLPTGVLPERCLNGNGFVVSKNGFQWINLQSVFKSKTFMKAELVLSADGKLKGKLILERTGYHAQRQRKKFFLKGEEEYIKDLVSSKAWEINKSEFQNSKEIGEAFKETHQLLINDHATVSTELIYLNPFIFLRVEENPFKLEKREYPVDFGSVTENVYMCQLTIPDGFVVDEMPKSKALKLPENSARYSYNVLNAGNIITITSSFQINRNIFIQDEYPNLREFYNQVVAKQAEQIVLKKK